jgi:hypothetical protein
MMWLGALMDLERSFLVRGRKEMKSSRDNTGCVLYHRSNKNHQIGLMEALSTDLKFIFENQ